MKYRLTILLALIVAQAFQPVRADRNVRLTKPNILFIAVDDLKPMLGCYGNADIKSPNIDKLAEQGMVFLNNSCQQAVCGPSRASLMSGCYPDTTRVYDLKTKMRDMNPDILTLPEYFKQQGYETTGTGKVYDPRCVGNAFDEPSWSIPFRQRPADEFFSKEMGPSVNGFHDPRVREDNKAFKAYLKANAIKKSDKAAWNKAFVRFPFAKPPTECLDLPDDAYGDGATLNSAIEQMDLLAKGGKPFFLAVGFSKPHLPFVAPRKYWDLYDRSKIELALFQEMPQGAPDYAFQDSWEVRGTYSRFPLDGPASDDLQRELIHGYRACVSYTDALVGKLIDHLKTLGLADNTIVVLWGDHGWHLGDHGMFCKHTNYEQAVRSPLIFAAPGQKAKGAKTESPSEFVDIFPTLCELAGLPIPESCEGLSLVPILGNPEAMVREAALEQFPRWPSRMGYTLRDKRYRYVKWIENDYKNGTVTGPTVATELYDYEKDPLETVNLADNPEYKSIVENFERIFKKRGVAQEK